MRWRDLGIGAVLTAVLGIIIWADFGSSRDPDLGAYLFAAGIGLVVLLRRWSVVAVLLLTAAAVVAYYAAGYPVVGLALPMSAALYVTSAAGRLRFAVGVVVALLAFAVAIRLVEGDDRAFLLYDTLATAAMMTAFLALGDARRSKRLLREETRQRLRLAEQDRQRDAEQLLAAQRLTIARDLHDSLSHDIAVIALHSLVAQESAPDLPTPTRAALRHIRSAAQHAMRDLRGTVSSLREDGAAPHRPPPGLGDLATLVDRVEAAGLRVELNTRGEPYPLPPIVDTTAYRVVQEALTNCLRHADIEHAELELTFGPAAVEIAVVDRHPAGEPGAAREGNGMRGMRERVELIGGTLTAGPGANGFGVQARLPLVAA